MDAVVARRACDGLCRVATYEWETFIVSRFLRGSIVLDARSQSAFELGEAAATALDTLSRRAHWARGASFSEGSDCAREALFVVRRELFGQPVLRPGEAATFEGACGRPLLRRFAEPPSWRSARDLGDEDGRLGVYAITVRVAAGALVVVGKRGDVERFVVSAAALGVDAVGRDLVKVEPFGLDVFQTRSGVWADSSAIHELWILSPDREDHVVLRRLSDTRAFVALLEFVRTRPDVVDASALATTCVALPHFRATVPRTVEGLATILRTYGALSP